jgi:cell division protein FtsB
VSRNIKKRSLPSVATQKKFIRGVLLLIGASLLIIFIFGDHGLVQLYKLKKERKAMQDHITTLRKNRETLASEKNRLENDLDYIEKLAREKYRMAKEGEKVFKVLYNKGEIKKED